jgi:hypothetical protein
MIATFSLLLSSVALSFASPLGDLAARTVTALNTAAFEEAQQRDDTATRAFSSTEIKVCLQLSSNWRLVLTNRPLRVNVSLSTNYLAIFARIWILFKSVHVMDQPASYGTSLLKGSMMTKPVLCLLWTPWYGASQTSLIETDVS